MQIIFTLVRGETILWALVENPRLTTLPLPPPLLSFNPTIIDGEEMFSLPHVFLSIYTPNKQRINAQLPIYQSFFFFFFSFLLDKLIFHSTKYRVQGMFCTKLIKDFLKRITRNGHQIVRL